MNLSPEIQTHESTSRHKRLSPIPGGFVDRVFAPFDPKAGDPKPMNSNPGIKTQESKSMNPSPESQTRESTSRHKRLSPSPGGFADRVFPAFKPQRQES